MGKINFDTARKCILGVAYAVAEGKPISPSTQENCAVSAREVSEALKDAPKPSASPSHAARKSKDSKRHPKAELKNLRRLKEELKRLDGKTYELLKRVPPRGGESMQRLLRISPQFSHDLQEYLLKHHGQMLKYDR